MKPKSKPNISKTSEDILKYFNFCADKGYRPSVREIAKELGIKSTNTVFYHMERLGIPKRKKSTITNYGTNMVEVRRNIIERLGGKCVKCGFSDIRALQIDHVRGGGNKEREELGSNRAMYVKIIKEIEDGVVGNYQVLCANCNWIKKNENKEHWSNSGSGNKKTKKRWKWSTK